MLKDKRGFTLIEIVLVLAIAGFVIIMVFLAITGAQRSRRDAKRQSDLGRIFGAIETYGSANMGQYPDTAAFNGFWTSNYVSNLTLTAPAGSPYTVTGGWPATAVVDGVYYRRGLTCGDAPTDFGFSVRMGLEIGQACRDIE